MAQHDFVPAWLNFSTPQSAKSSTATFEKHGENLSRGEVRFGISRRRHNSSDGFFNNGPLRTTGDSWHQSTLFHHDSVDSGVSKGTYAGITGNLSGWHGSSRGHDGVSQRSGASGNHRHWNGSFHSRKGCAFQEKPPTEIREEKKEDKVEKLQFEEEDFPSLNPEAGKQNQPCRPIGTPSGLGLIHFPPNAWKANRMEHKSGSLSSSRESNPVSVTKPVVLATGTVLSSPKEVSEELSKGAVFPPKTGYYVAQAGHKDDLEFLILILPPLKYWDYWHAALHSALCVVGHGTQGFAVGKHCTFYNVTFHTVFRKGSQAALESDQSSSTHSTSLLCLSRAGFTAARVRERWEESCGLPYGRPKLPRRTTDRKSEFLKTLKDDHNGDLSENRDSDKLEDVRVYGKILYWAVQLSLLMYFLCPFASPRLLKAMGWQEYPENDESCLPLTEDELKEFHMKTEQLRRNGFGKNGFLQSRSSGLFSPWRRTCKAEFEDSDTETSSSETSDDDAWK
ncbi:vasculin-like protein 1 [Nannospalax galili]|uniref:vasculin-like protein 1 n=1 Tax=Nannospalax galili TaxID=1026970 RepID=UPI00111C509A|nr:vasculin-like protein 1 [Nannospalax galili]